VQVKPEGDRPQGTRLGLRAFLAFTTVAWASAALGTLLCGAVSFAAASEAPEPAGVVLKAVDPLTTVYADKGFLEVSASGGAFRRFDEVNGLGAIRLVGPRNGVCSAQVVARASRPGEVRAGVSALRSAGGAIPNDAVRVRYAHDVGPKKDILVFADTPGHPCQFFARAYHYRSYHDVLLPAPPDDGPFVPVWVTVSVPANAAPGQYRGTFRAGGRELPVELTVCDWACPGLQQFATYVSLLQSPESLAAYYGVAAWSDEHLALIGESFGLMGQLGNRSVCVPVLHGTHLGNDGGMVRFSRSGDAYELDFAIAEKYLDLYREHVGAPGNIVLYVWDATSTRGRRAADTVTVSQRADGKAAELEVPAWGRPGSEAVWGPLMDGFRTVVEQRGWDRATVQLGLAGDQRPPARVVDFFGQIAPWATWAIFTHGHSDPDQVSGRLLVDGMEIGVYETVYVPMTGHDGYGNLLSRSGGLLGGWDCDYLRLSSAREYMSEYAPLSQWRWLAEAAVARGPAPDHHRRNFASSGLCRMGADYWDIPSVEEDGSWYYGGRRLIMRSFAQHWPVVYRPYSPKAILGPGPTGPVATARSEMLREGIQECEARIAIEKALARGGVPPDLERRCRDLLTERIEVRFKEGTWGDVPYQAPNPEREVYTRLWGIAPNWQDLTARLFDLAGEVAGAGSPSGMAKHE